MLKKKIIGVLLVLSVLGIDFSSSLMVQASSDIYPVEVVTPNQPLFPNEEVVFYILVNDDKLRDEIEYFNFGISGLGIEPEKIPYNGESYISLKKKIPSPKSLAERYQTITEVYLLNEKKIAFTIYQNIDFSLKYPLGQLSSEFGIDVKSVLSQKDFKLANLKASAGHISGELRDPGYTINFDPDFIKTYTDDELAQAINERKETMRKVLDGPVYNWATPVINQWEASPSDSEVKKIDVVDSFVYRIYTGDGSFNPVIYEMESYVYVSQFIDKEENKQRVFPYQFRKRAVFRDLGSYEAEMEEFRLMVSSFAKSIVFEKPQNLEFTEHKPTISLSNNNFSGTLSGYDLENLNHSEEYKQILKGNIPGVEETVREKKALDNREFNLSFKFNNNVSIWNSGVVNTGTDKDTDFPIFINIHAKAFDKDGKEIKDATSEELYSDVYAVYEIKTPVSQIGINEGQGWQNSIKVKVDNNVSSQYLKSKGPIVYKGPYFPVEFVEVYLVNSRDEKLSESLIYTVKIKNAAPVLEMENGVVEIDDTADGVFKFIINDEYHEELECTIKIPYEKYQANKVPVPVVSRESSGGGAEYIDKFKCKPNEWITIRVTPPKLSNFNMLAEMDGLSMWDLQRGTMEGFAMDLVGVGVDARLDSLGDSKKLLEGIHAKGYTENTKGVFDRINNYEQSMRTLSSANKLAADSQNAIKLSQLKTNVESHIKDVEDATSGAGEKDWVETGYDWGIGGINILQSTVGAVAMAPGKIPFVGKYAQKVTGKFSLVFNLMTNVWKGNLQYLSKEKKLDRAQEKNIPYPIIVTAVSKDGFEDTDAQVVSVIYTYLEQ